jgi:hypothetical protein
MKIYVMLVIAVILPIRNAVSQTPPIPECPIESNVSTVLSKLKIDIIFGNVQLDAEWQKNLKMRYMLILQLAKM